MLFDIVSLRWPRSSGNYRRDDRDFRRINPAGGTAKRLSQCYLWLALLEKGPGFGYDCPLFHRHCVANTHSACNSAIIYLIGGYGHERKDNHWQGNEIPFEWDFVIAG